MSKTTHVQRPLFGPWLAWEQLPDSVREQALDVLTAKNRPAHRDFGSRFQYSSSRNF
jgi:hypothetical protein